MSASACFAVPTVEFFNTFYHIWCLSLPCTPPHCHIELRLLRLQSETLVPSHLSFAIINMCDKMRKSFFLILSLFFRRYVFVSRTVCPQICQIVSTQHTSNSLDPKWDVGPIPKIVSNTRMWSQYICATNSHWHTRTQVSSPKMKSSELNYTGKI